MGLPYYMLKKGNETIYSGNNRAEMMELIPKDDRYLYHNTPKYNLLEVSINLEDLVVVRFSNNLHWKKDEVPRETGYFTSSGHGYFIFSPENFKKLLEGIKQNTSSPITLLKEDIAKLASHLSY